MKQSELQRKTALRRGRPKPLSVSAREKSEAWHRGIGCTCMVCGNTYRVECDAHHIVPLQTLRREAKRLGFDFERVRWDRRNRLACCRICHERHTSRHRPISRSVLVRHASKVFQFARELNLTWALDREYPEPVREAVA